jgi:hypothetical protein
LPRRRSRHTARILGGAAIGANHFGNRASYVQKHQFGDVKLMLALAPVAPRGHILVPQYLFKWKMISALAAITYSELPSHVGLISPDFGETGFPACRFWKANQQR